MDIKKYMNSSDDCLYEFIHACDDMISSKYILADKKISNILQTIAASTKLYELFEGALSNFDFGLEFAKSKIPNSFNHTILKLPTDRMKNIAYVFCLLYQLDTKGMEIKNFLNEFYYSENINEQYQNFCRTVITQFKKNTEIVFVEGEDFNGEVKSAESFFDDETTESKIDSNAVEKMVTIMREIISIVSKEPYLNLAERDEILTVCEGLNNTIFTKNSKLIKILFIGFKNTAKLSKVYKSISNNIDELTALLNEYHILL